MSRKTLENFVFIILAVICVISWYFYKPEIVNFWNQGVEKSQKISDDSWNFLVNIFGNISMPDFDLKKIFSLGQKENDNEALLDEEAPKVIIEKNCGTGLAPNLKDPRTYQNDPALKCLSLSAERCENAKAVLDDDLFPTVFQIGRDENDQNCNFILSYPQDSALFDVTGKKLSGQYISCPIGIVKKVDETKSVPSFSAPSRGKEGKEGKYAAEIYFYGTIGVFMENNVEKDKIERVGCRGSYIDSVIASYDKMQMEN